MVSRRRRELSSLGGAHCLSAPLDENSPRGAEHRARLRGSDTISRRLHRCVARRGCGDRRCSSLPRASRGRRARGSGGSTRRDIQGIRKGIERSVAHARKVGARQRADVRCGARPRSVQLHLHVCGASGDCGRLAGDRTTVRNSLEVHVLASPKRAQENVVREAGTAQSRSRSRSALYDCDRAG